MSVRLTNSSTFDQVNHDSQGAELGQNDHHGASHAPSDDFRRIDQELKRTKKLMIARIAFTTLFILTLLILCIVKNEKLQVLSEGECLRDYTFIWTESINNFFVNHTAWKNFAIIQSSIGIDGMMLSWLVIFFFYGNTLRIACTLSLFYPLRNVIQTIFLMGRPVGFLWSYPGIMSLTVPYFDTNDFYFSGHVGSTTIFASEYIAMGWKKMAITISLIVVDVWVTLMFLRTHYIIDFTSGYVFARVVHRIGEKLSYYPDVKIFKYPRDKRFAHNYNPCPKCGWGNENPLLVTSTAEVELQRTLYAGSILDNTKSTIGGVANGSGSPLCNNSDDEDNGRPQHKEGGKEDDPSYFQPSINSPKNSIYEQ